MADNGQPSGAQVELPNLYDFRLNHLSACAFIPKSKAGNIDDGIASHTQSIVTKFGSARKQCFARLVRGIAKSKYYHWHIDLARKSYFGADETPKELSRIGEWRSVVELVIGATARSLLIDCYWSAKADELPPDGLIRSLVGLSTGEGDEEIELKGAMFSLRQEPFVRLQWRQEDNEIIIQLRAFKADEHLGSEYLLNAARLMQSGIDKIILKR